MVVGVGANAKMNEFCAIMGLCNLKHVERDIAERKQRVGYYLKKLEGRKELDCPVYRDDIRYTYGYFPVLFREELCGCGMRDIVYERLKESGIYSRKYFYPVTSDEVCFKNKYRDIAIENARYVSENILVLPLHPDLEYEIMDEIAEIVTECLDTRTTERGM